MLSENKRSFVRCLRWRSALFIALLAALLSPRCVMAQSSDQQLWVDGILGRNFEAVYMFETEFSYQTLITKGEQWKSLNVSPSIERSMTPHWDLMFCVPLSYTLQDNSTNTFETRLQLGTRFYFTPFARVQTRLTIRQEQRFLTTLEPDRSTQQSSRTRFRAELIVPLDQRNYAVDTMWYALADFEAFLTYDKELDERFANRTRARIGIGRKFSYNFRTEFIYCFQRSRTTMDDTEYTDESIFRLRFKYYFTPPNRRRDMGDNSN